MVFGSTNLSWRGLYVQANNALMVDGTGPVDRVRARSTTTSTNEDAVRRHRLGETRPSWPAGHRREGIVLAAHGGNALLETIARDIEHRRRRRLFYSLAFLYHYAGGRSSDAIKKVSANPTSVRLRHRRQESRRRARRADAERQYQTGLSRRSSTKTCRQPFKAEPTGGSETSAHRMHHKFVVIDFDNPATARVYLGSYNFSPAGRQDNGENLLLIRDQRIAVSYLVEALRIFDHYHFRVTQNEARGEEAAGARQAAAKEGQKPWFDDDYTDPRRFGIAGCLRGQSRSVPCGSAAAKMR